MSNEILKESEAKRKLDRLTQQVQKVLDDNDFESIESIQKELNMLRELNARHVELAKDMNAKFAQQVADLDRMHLNAEQQAAAYNEERRQKIEAQNKIVLGQDKLSTAIACFSVLAAFVDQVAIRNQFDMADVDHTVKMFNRDVKGEQ